MAPDYTRKDTDFVYIYPDDSTTYSYQDATNLCVDTFGAGLPSIHSKLEAQNMGLDNTEQNGN